MGKIGKLARLSVLRACAFCCLGVFMVMMGSAHDPAASLRFGAAGMLILSAILWYRGETYDTPGRRITETEVWYMLDETERPPKHIARDQIIRAMRAELFQKSGWSAIIALWLVGISAFVTLTA